MSARRRYIAFISYSHADERQARWLQRALERYRVPKRLRAGRPDLPARLYPVFRDREELASATDLSESIQAAMADSDALIVICSPVAAGSRWVNEEVRHFRRHHGGGRIFCLMVAGRPDADAADCAFPPTLLRDDDGEPLPEPLAADFTRSGDGPRGALLKIAAGLLGVGIDELRRRDAQRQARLWSAVAAGSLAVAALTIGLAAVALMAREESELRRQQAENLIGFMLGDLRGKLQPIGKLDLLDAVGDQAMDYFAALGERGSDRERLARAMALRQIGEVRFNQGRLEPALASFQQSLDQARALYEQAPDHNDYLFELGQAEFWVGYVAWQRNDLDGADEALQRYMQRSSELLAREPDNRDYRLELSYAHGNLGSVARERGRDIEALDSFRRSEAILRQLLAADPLSHSLQFELAERLSWIGSTLLDLGRLEESERTFRETFELLSELHATSANPRYSHKFGDVGRLLGHVRLHQGALSDAAALAALSSEVNRDLFDHDPTNANWRRALYASLGFQGEVALAAGKHDQATEWVAEALAGLADLNRSEPSDAEYSSLLALAERTQALLWLQQGRTRDALALCEQAMARMATIVADRGRHTARLTATLVAETLGRIQAAAGQLDQARSTWQDAFDRLADRADTDTIGAALRVQLGQDLGLIDQTRSLATRLCAAGFADPRFPIPCANAP